MLSLFVWLKVIALSGFYAYSTNLQTFSSVLTGVVVRDFDLPVFGFVFLKSTTVWPIPESKRGMKICDKAKGSSINDVTQLLTPLYPSLSFLVQRLQKNH
jgi:hypothetical protein